MYEHIYEWATRIEPRRSDPDDLPREVADSIAALSCFAAEHMIDLLGPGAFSPNELLSSVAAIFTTGFIDGVIYSEDGLPFGAVTK